MPRSRTPTNASRIGMALASLGKRKIKFCTGKRDYFRFSLDMGWIINYVQRTQMKNAIFQCGKVKDFTEAVRLTGIPSAKRLVAVRELGEAQYKPKTTFLVQYNK